MNHVVSCVGRVAMLEKNDLGGVRLLPDELHQLLDERRVPTVDLANQAQGHDLVGPHLFVQAPSHLLREESLRDLVEVGPHLALLHRRPQTAEHGQLRFRAHSPSLQVIHRVPLLHGEADFPVEVHQGEENDAPRRHADQGDAHREDAELQGCDGWGGCLRDAPEHDQAVRPREALVPSRDALAERPHHVDLLAQRRVQAPEEVRQRSDQGQALRGRRDHRVQRLQALQEAVEARPRLPDQFLLELIKVLAALHVSDVPRFLHDFEHPEELQYLQHPEGLRDLARLHRPHCGEQLVALTNDVPRDARYQVENKPCLGIIDHARSALHYHHLLLQADDAGVKVEEYVEHEEAQAHPSGDDEPRRQDVLVEQELEGDEPQLKCQEDAPQDFPSQTDPPHRRDHAPVRRGRAKLVHLELHERLDPLLQLETAVDRVFRARGVGAPHGPHASDAALLAPRAAFCAHGAIGAATAAGAAGMFR
mmetsp:Transcript_85307/g.246282  ORF Transcript_85307/g.246282 Transcript_85307/m.246282 type:complete len:478 (+) Transcript_85307:1406-2839(+)